LGASAGVACQADEGAVRRLDGALALAGRVVAAVSVPVEIDHYVAEAGLRHGGANSCPHLDPIDADAWLLDYNHGCVPRSGWLPATVSGTLALDVGPTAVVATSLDLTVDLEARVEASIELPRSSDQAIGWVSANDWVVELDIAIVRSGDHARITGSAVVDGVDIELDDVRLGPATTACIAPVAGMARVPSEMTSITFGDQVEAVSGTFAAKVGACRYAALF
jgi:hypothetical protein